MKSQFSQLVKMKIFILVGICILSELDFTLQDMNLYENALKSLKLEAGSCHSNSLFPGYLQF